MRSNAHRTCSSRFRVASVGDVCVGLRLRTWMESIRRPPSPRCSRNCLVASTTRQRCNYAPSLVCAQDGSSKTAAISISDLPISVQTGGKRFVVIVIIGTVKLYISTSYVTYVGVVGSSLGTRPFAVRRKGLGTCPHWSCPYGMQLCVVISDLWWHHAHVRCQSARCLPSTFVKYSGKTQNRTAICRI